MLDMTNASQRRQLLGIQDRLVDLARNQTLSDQLDGRSDLGNHQHLNRFRQYGPPNDHIGLQLMDQHCREKPPSCIKTVMVSKRKSGREPNWVGGTAFIDFVELGSRKRAPFPLAAAPTGEMSQMDAAESPAAAASSERVGQSV